MSEQTTKSCRECGAPCFDGWSYCLRCRLDELDQIAIDAHSAALSPHPEPGDSWPGGGSWR